MKRVQLMWNKIRERSYEECQNGALRNIKRGVDKCIEEMSVLSLSLNRVLGERERERRIHFLEICPSILALFLLTVNFFFFFLFFLWLN